MIDVNSRALELRQLGILRGTRPLLIKILKGDYPYVGEHVLTIDDEHIYLFKLNKKYMYKRKLARDFKIAYDNLEGFRFTFEKTCYKRITLIFKDGLEFNFLFVCECSEAGHNEDNAVILMKKLKEKNILQKNNLKGGKCEQRTISKADQLFVKEVRSPSKKRGLFR